MGIGAGGGVGLGTLFGHSYCTTRTAAPGSLLGKPILRASPFLMRLRFRVQGLEVGTVKVHLPCA